jgi:hypothetical protein
MSSKGPIKGTRIQDGRYYLVRADGKRRIWIQLTKVAEGMAALYAALAEASKAPTLVDDMMPKVIASWEKIVMANHAETTQRDERARGKVIANEFEEFRAADIQSPDVTVFLEQYADRPTRYARSSRR